SLAIDEAESRRSKAKAVVGAIHYISPEQTGRVDRRVDQRSDLYSLGIVLYECLTGQLPFTGADELEVIHGQMAKKPRPLTQLRAETPVALDQIVVRLMEKDASARYQSAQGLLFDLEESWSL